MKNNEKSLMEEILDRKKDNGKNGLLDNDDTLLDSTVHNLPKTEQLKKNYSQDSEISRTNSKIKNLSNLNTTEKIKEKPNPDIIIQNIPIKRLFFLSMIKLQYIKYLNNCIFKIFFRNFLIHCHI